MLPHLKSLTVDGSAKEERGPLRAQTVNYRLFYCTVRLKVVECCACGCVASVTVTVIIDVPGEVGVLMLTVALPDLVPSAWAVAVTVTAPTGTASGAVYNPLAASIIPLAAPPPTVQVTPGFREL